MSSPLASHAGTIATLAGFLGYNAGLPPYGIPIGLAMPALGWWITRSGRTPAVQLQGARSGP